MALWQCHEGAPAEDEGGGRKESGIHRGALNCLIKVLIWWLQPTHVTAYAPCAVGEHRPGAITWNRGRPTSPRLPNPKACLVSSHPPAPPSRLLFPLPRLPLRVSSRRRPSLAQSPAPPQTLAPPRSRPEPRSGTTIRPARVPLLFLPREFLLILTFGGRCRGAVGAGVGVGAGRQVKKRRRCSSRVTRRRGGGSTSAGGATRSGTARCCWSRRARSGAGARASASRTPPPRRSRSVHDSCPVPPGVAWSRALGQCDRAGGLATSALGSVMSSEIQLWAFRWLWMVMVQLVKFRRRRVVC